LTKRFAHAIIGVDAVAIEDNRLTRERTPTDVFEEKTQFGLDKLKKRGTITINGQPVAFRESSRPLKRVYGYARKNQEIVISRGLKPHKRLEIAIHEMLHELHWGLSEEFVRDAAKEIADGLKEMEIVNLPDN
jgi:hypothetical protein